MINEQNKYYCQKCNKFNIARPDIKCLSCKTLNIIKQEITCLKCNFINHAKFTTFQYECEECKNVIKAFKKFNCIKCKNILSCEVLYNKFKCYQCRTLNVIVKNQDNKGEKVNNEKSSGENTKVHVNVHETMGRGPTLDYLRKYGMPPWIKDNE